MPNLTWFIPILGKIFPSTDTYLNQDLCDNYGEIISLMRKMIEEHKETYDRDNVRDFIDAYLLHIEEVCVSAYSSSGYDTKSGGMYI